MTKRYKLHVTWSDVSFWLLLFDDDRRLGAYLNKHINSGNDWVLGCCVTDIAKREIVVCLSRGMTGPKMVGHELFHAVTGWVRLHKDKIKRGAWMRIRNEDTAGGKLEETLADLSGILHSEVDRVLG